MAPNERLRSLMTEAGVSIDDLVSALSVNRRTVERWIDENRLPYPRHRSIVAGLLAQDERFIWPQIDMSETRRIEVSRSELVSIYPRRSLIPTTMWTQLLDSAEERIEILVQAGLFLPEQHPELVKQLAEKADAGVAVRVLLGDSDGDSVLRRGGEEGIGDAIRAKAANALSFYQPYRDDVEVRLHDATLYNSLYRFDRDMIVNTHIYGQPAAHNPALHLRRLDDGELFTNYYEAFDRIWYSSRPAWAD